MLCPDSCCTTYLANRLGELWAEMPISPLPLYTVRPLALCSQFFESQSQRIAWCFGKTFPKCFSLLAGCMWESFLHRYAWQGLCPARDYITNQI